MGDYLVIFTKNRLSFLMPIREGEYLYDISNLMFHLL